MIHTTYTTVLCGNSTYHTKLRERLFQSVICSNKALPCQQERPVELQAIAVHVCGVLVCKTQKPYVWSQLMNCAPLHTRISDAHNDTVVAVWHMSRVGKVFQHDVKRPAHHQHMRGAARVCV
jgi:hypothetical protein